MKPLRIALTKGRLEKDTVALFEKIGYDCSAVREKGWNSSPLRPRNMTILPRSGSQSPSN